MIKKIAITFLLCYSTLISFAAVNSDSLAYQLERKKINVMLSQRAIKFGQYDQSLSKHTGIFGLQTKKDIRHSNEILMDIVKTDNAIYKELKILLEFSIFQRTQIQTHSKEAENSNLGFMMTINKLRDQVDQLKADAERQQRRNEKTRLQLIMALIVSLGLILLLLFFKRQQKA